jgi:hypothetical protein
MGLYTNKKRFEDRGSIQRTMFIVQILGLLIIMGLVYVVELGTRLLEDSIAMGMGQDGGDAAAKATAMVLLFSAFQLLLALAFSAMWWWRVGRARIFPFRGDPFKGIYVGSFILYVVLAIVIAIAFSVLTLLEALPLMIGSALGSMAISILVVAKYSPPEARYVPIGAKLFHRPRK